VELAEYINGEKQAPLPTYFIGAFGKGSALALASLSQTGSTGTVQYLGRSGIKKLYGLNVAYLDGTHDAKEFQEGDEDAVTCRHYTKVVPHPPQVLAGVVHSMHGINDCLLGKSLCIHGDGTTCRQMFAHWKQHWSRRMGT
jgi:hypothetical protein